MTVSLFVDSSGPLLSKAFSYNSIQYLLIKKVITRNSTFREEPCQINVILQQKLAAPKLSVVCIVYKQ